MAQPTIYYWPPGATSVQTIDLGGNISLLEVRDLREVADAAPLGGTYTRHDYGGYRTVRIRKEKIQDAAMIRKLRTLATYLQSGRTIGFAYDSGKTWGGWATTVPAFGDGSVTIGRNAFAYMNASGVLSVSDELTIESANPELLREVAIASAISGTTITVTGGVLQTYGQTPVFIRYADLYPVLRVAEGQILQPTPVDERRLYWDWDITFVEWPGDLVALKELEFAFDLPEAGNGAALSWDDLLAKITKDRMVGTRIEWDDLYVTPPQRGY